MCCSYYLGIKLRGSGRVDERLDASTHRHPCVFGHVIISRFLSLLFSFFKIRATEYLFKKFHKNYELVCFKDEKI